MPNKLDTLTKKQHDNFLNNILKFEELRKIAYLSSEEEHDIYCNELYEKYETQIKALKVKNTV